MTGYLSGDNSAPSAIRACQIRPPPGPDYGLAAGHWQRGRQPRGQPVRAATYSEPS